MAQFANNREQKSLARRAVISTTLLKGTPIHVVREILGLAGGVVTQKLQAKVV